MLPVRNAAAELDDWLEAASVACDGVVALDDGSTDGTRERLEASPLVLRVLANPPREGHAGWDDGANRARLLEAAAELEPLWLISLDADERLDRPEAVALRRFLQTDAIPGCAYGFQHCRMWGAHHFDSAVHWLYRLFAFAPGQVFPTGRLHFNPIPVDVPRRLRVRTTLRIQHFGAVDEAMRLARLEKYREADPAEEYPTNFGGLSRPPAGRLVPWRPRPADLPVLA
jgi:hypothetical protein